MKLNCDFDLSSANHEADKLINKLVQIEELTERVNEIKLLSIKDVMELTGWCKSTTRNFFNLPGFPVISVGKEKQVEVGALKEFLRKGIVL